MCFGVITRKHDPSPVMSFLRKSGLLLAVSSQSNATAANTNRFCSCDSSNRGTNLAVTCFIPLPSAKISKTQNREILRSNSRAVSYRISFIATRRRSTFSDVLLVKGLPVYGSLSTGSQPALKRLYLNSVYPCITQLSFRVLPS